MFFSSRKLENDELAVLMRVSAHLPDGTHRKLWEFTLPQGVVLHRGEVVVIEFSDRRRRPR